MNASPLPSDISSASSCAPSQPTCPSRTVTLSCSLIPLCLAFLPHSAITNSADLESCLAFVHFSPLLPSTARLKLPSSLSKFYIHLLSGPLPPTLLT
jgi:hypothetical protein